MTSADVRTWGIRWGIPLLCAGILAVVSVPGRTGPAFQRIPVGSGVATAWTMPDLEGKPVSSSQFAGKVVLLNFWATWCPPCVREIPDLNQFQIDHAAEGFTVIGASVESADPKTVSAFAARRKLRYPVVLADDAVQGLFGGISANPLQPGGLPLPTTYIIGRDGRYVARYIGALDRKELDRMILPLLHPASPVSAQPH